MKTKCYLSILIVILFPIFAVAENLDEQLIEASRKGETALVQTLLERGANVNAKGRYDVTPLTVASSNGHLEIVKMLIERGAALNTEDTFYHSTPISWAAGNGHMEVVKLLAKKGAKADGALTDVIYNQDTETVRFLLENVKFSQETLTQALEIATSENLAEISRLLEKAGAVKRMPAVKLTPEVLKIYSGKFRNSEGTELTFSAAENSLNVTGTGQDFVLIPMEEKKFEMIGGSGYLFEFEVSNGKSDRFTVTRPDGSTSVYSRVLETAEKSTEPVKEKKSVDPSLLKTQKVSKPLHWPSFRGASASGVADGQYPPALWDVENGTNILWKTPIPGLANSSPIIWGNQIFVTTAITSDPDSKLRHGLYGDVKPSGDLTKHTWRIYSIDKNSGKVLWDKIAFEGAPNVKRHPKSTQSNSTPVTDGKHVVALFGFGGLHCYDFKGNLLWKSDLGILDSGWFYDPDYQWGHGSSPVIFDDLVIVQADLQKNSFIAAFNLKDGKLAWKTLRDEIPSWGTPTVVKTENGAQVVTNGTNYVRGYDARTGKEIWKLKGNSEITVPTPFVAHDLVYVTSGYRPIQPIYAIRTNASGDISLKEGSDSNEHIAWSTKRGGPYMPTPVVYGDYLYTCGNNGVVTCYHAKTGERIYQKRLGGQGSGYAFTASPVAADGKLYFPSEDGEVYVVKAGPEYEVLAINKMNEVIMATPAISDGMIVIRTLDHVYGIQSK